MIPSEKSTSLAELRRNYTQAGLLEKDVHDNPLNQFQLWMDAAIEAELPEPNAMTLSTVSELGKPSSRVVLLKGLDAHGFIFYTNYGSRKGQEMAHNPWVSLVFLWLPLERQVRIEGQVAKVSEQETAAYFHSRPRGSQLGALASQQSQRIRDRQVLEQSLNQLVAQYEGHPIPCPSDWGGYRVSPERIEFWQGRPNRLHDRLCYDRSDSERWSLFRLAP